MPNDTTPRVRRAPLPDDAVMVVRGDVLDGELLGAGTARFRRRYPDWDRVGVIGYYTRDDTEVNALCQTKMANFETVVVFAIRDLDRAGINVLGTFRTPHVTLAARDIQTLLEALISCPYQVRANPYHGNATTEEAR
ncbi:MAG: hypothetical protein HHJ11_07670 [Phycicoccus sp.]|nr:hypothetical protein [Phycicoccus sp.]NMM35835.1 hypothetical protein [Phycicoccus sp.]